MTTHTHYRHCAMNRRQFLGALFALAGVGFIRPGIAFVPQPATFWWASLDTGAVSRDRNIPPPAGLPGSIMKLIATAYILEERLSFAHERLECRGHITLGGQTYHCQAPHGTVGLLEALGYSCNVFFAQAATAIHPARFLAAGREFGLDRPVAGYPPAVYPKFPGNRIQAYVLGLSPDLQPTMLQLLGLSSLIATQGQAPPLYLTEDNKPPAALSSPHLSPATWQFLQEGMRLAARQGTAKKLDPGDRLHLAVKTGTAPHGPLYQSWITGFFPFAAPRYVFGLRAYTGTSVDAAVPQARHHLFSRTWPACPL